MDKGIGFNRNIKLEWLNATAAFCAEMDDPLLIRQRLEPIIRQEISSDTNIRKSIDILLNIWFKYEGAQVNLHQTALSLFQNTAFLPDRIWLHYGMTTLTYPFFYQTVTAVGQLSRYDETIAATAVRDKLFAELGALGSIKAAVSRVVYSLRDWGILVDASARNSYTPQYRHFEASQISLEQWLLAAVLHAHPAEQIPFADLLHLPALFPFKFTLTVRDLREAAGFEVQRQGGGLDMVSVRY
jgi:hypothetical protein